MATDINSHKKYIDIFKGFLILSVLLGHSWLKLGRIVFLFHMPLFFMLSGFLFKMSQNVGISNFIAQKAVRLIIPYFTFGMLNLYISKPVSFTNSFFKLLYGGREIGGVYWFITTLFLSQIFVFIIEKYHMNKIYPTLFIFAVIESNYILKSISISDSISLWWNIDVCLLAIPYIALGYHLKKLISSAIEKYLTTGISIKTGFYFVICICAIIILMYYCKFDFTYTLDMKYGYYPNPMLILLFPLFFGFCFLLVSLNLVKTPLGTVLAIIGKSSMTIMYIHILIRDKIFIPFCGKHYSILLWIAITCIISFTFDTICKRNRLLALLFGIRKN